MPLTLAQFHSQISSIINEGTSADAFIPTAVRQAAMFFERNYSFKYMERFVTFTIDSSATNPRYLDFPLRFKSFGDEGFFRILLEDGAYGYLDQISAKQMDSLEEGRPDGFWFDGNQYLVLNKTPTEDYDCEMLYVQFSDWPTDYSQTPWLLEFGEEALLARSMKMLQPYVNSPKLNIDYKEIEEQGLRTMLIADEEWRRSNRSEQMQYA